MTVLKEYNPHLGIWETIFVGALGPAGPTGPTGPQGSPGIGTGGAGLTNGGGAYTQLVKRSASDYDTVWQTKDIFDVRDDGAVGDGTTLDTTLVLATINRAIAAGGGSVYLPSGKTYLTARILLSSVTVPLRFYGGGTLKLAAANTALVQVDTPATPVVFDGVRFDGNAVALTNVTCGLLRVSGAGAMVTARSCEFYNSPHSGPTSYNGGRITTTGCSCHDLGTYGILVQGVGAARVTSNDVYTCGNGGIKVTNTSAIVSEGISIFGNTVRDIRADLGGTGEYGNGIGVYQVNNVSISGNAVTNVAFSFIRTNRGSNISIAGNTCDTCGETGIFVEFGASYCTVTGNVVKNADEYGICMANASYGATGMVASGNTVWGFGTGGDTNTCIGIQVSNGLVTGNHIDGLGNVGAVWGVFAGSGSGTGTAEFRVGVTNNQIAGTKWGVAHAISHSSGTSETWITGNQITRKDANYQGPLAAATTNNVDGGSAAAISATNALRIYVGDNNFDIPTAQTPQPFMAGSRVKINGGWRQSDGLSWNTGTAPATFNVRDYGAKGDGVADDSAAIQAAITAAAVAGGVVTGRTGDTYDIGPVWPVIPTGQRITFDMQGAYLRFNASSTTVLLEVLAATSQLITIRNTRFEGTGASGTGDIGLRLRNCQNVAVENCRFTTCEIALDLVNDGTGGGNAWTESNTFRNLEFLTCGTGVKMSTINGGDSSFAGNRFHDCMVTNTTTHFSVGAGTVFYGGMVDGWISFLSQNAASPVAFDIFGSVIGSTFQGRMEETGSGTPYAVRVDAAGSVTGSDWRFMLTGSGFRDPPIANASATTPRYQFFTGSGGGVDKDRTVLRQDLRVAGNVGFYNTAPIARPTVAVSATDPATVQTLVNSLRTALVNLGLVS